MVSKIFLLQKTANIQHKHTVIHFFSIEASHKVDPRQWLTIDPDNYRFSCNGQQKYSAWETVKVGTYNALIGQTNYYDANAIPFEESHLAFKRAFGEGFAWEVLEVYSGPPTVTFKWRHFGRMTDYFSCTGLSGLSYKVDPTNKMIKIYGMCKATVNEKFQVQDLQIFYDPSHLFTQLTEISPFAPFVKLPTTNILPNKTITKTETSPNAKVLVKNNAEENLQANKKAIEKSSTHAHSSICTIS